MKCPDCDRVICICVSYEEALEDEDEDWEDPWVESVDEEEWDWDEEKE